MTEAALMNAALLAHRFTVITLPVRTIAMSDRVLAPRPGAPLHGPGGRGRGRRSRTTSSRHLVEMMVAEPARALEDDCRGDRAGLCRPGRLVGPYRAGSASR